MSSFQKGLGSMFHFGGLSSLSIEEWSSGVASTTQLAMVLYAGKYSFLAGAFSWCHTVLRKDGGVGWRLWRNSMLRLQLVWVSVDAWR